MYITFSLSLQLLVTCLITYNSPIVYNRTIMYLKCVALTQTHAHNNCVHIFQLTPRTLQHKEEKWVYHIPDGVG